MFNNVFKKTMVLLMAFMFILSSFPIQSLNATAEAPSSPIIEEKKVEDKTKVEEKEKKVGEKEQTQPTKETEQPIKDDKAELVKKLEELEAKLSLLKEQEKKMLENSEEEDEVELLPENDNNIIEEPEKISESEYQELKKNLDNDGEKEKSALEDLQLEIQEVMKEIEDLKSKINQPENNDEDALDFGEEIVPALLQAQANTASATLNVNWLEGNVPTSANHISQNWQNGSKDIRARITYTLKSEEQFKPGELEISIPRYIYDDRDGKPIGEITLGVPRFPNARQPIAYIEKGDTITFVNVQQLPKSTTAYIELTYKSVRPEKIKDKSVGYQANPLKAIMNLAHNGSTINLESTKTLTTDVDTRAQVTSSYGEKGYPYEVYPDIFPEELKPANDNNYIYADYVYYMGSQATQPYNLKFKAMVENYGGIVLGVRDSSNNKIIKGNNTSTLETDVEVPNNYRQSGDRQNYMRVFVAFPANQFTENIVYSLRAKGEYTLTSIDDKETTVKSSSAAVPYKPIKFVAPDNHFGIDKNGDGNRKNWTGNKYEGEYSYGLNQLILGRDLDLLYDTRVMAFNLPFTYPSWDPSRNNKDENLDNYRQRQFTTEVKDGELETVFNKVDYEIKSLEMKDLTLYDYVKYPSSGYGYYEGVTGKIEYGFIPIGQFGYRSKTRLSDFSIKDKSYTFQILGSTDGTNYTPYANVDIDSGINIEPINGASKDGDKLIFPSGVKKYKTSFKSGIPGYSFNLYPTITIKADDASKALAEKIIGTQDIPMERFKTTGDMVGITDTNQTVDSKPEYAHDRAYGLVNGVRLKSDIDYSNDTENARVKVNYTVTMENQTNQSDMKDLKEAIDLGIIKEEKEATWYSLLPKGFDLNLDSVRSRTGDTILSKEIVKNYKNTNRTLLIVKVKQNPNYKMKFKNSSYDGSIIGLDGYVDSPQISYSGTYSWIMMKNYAIRSENSVDYRLTADNIYKSSNENLGNTKGLLGENSSASEKKNKYTNIDDIMKNIDGVNNKNSYLFDRNSTSLSVDTYAIIGAEKLVDVNAEGDYTMGTSTSDDKRVYENSYYRYRIALTTDGKSEAANMTIFDKIDGYELKAEEDNEFGSKTFKGIYQDLDLSMAESLGVKPTIYYSTKKNINIDYDNVSSDMDTSNSSIWSTTKPANNKDITAIAIDLSKKTDGGKFVLGHNQAIMTEIIVKAPTIKEVGQDAYAFNKSAVTFTGGLGDGYTKLIAKTQKTKVGIKPFYITVRGKFDDDDNRDGKRPNEIKVQLMKNGKAVSEVVSLNEAISMYKEFDGLEYQDATGKTHDYTFKVIDENKDYQYSISPAKKYEDRLEFEVTAKHEPERINIVGKKVWQGKKIGLLKRYEESPLNRPTSIKVRLVKNGSDFKTARIIPDQEGNWNIEFTNEFKYEKGQEIKYTFVEADEYIKGYIPAEYSSDTFTITNNYYPFGDLIIKNELIDATPKAKQAYFEYEVTVETQNPDGTYSVNMDAYPYETEKGTKGTVSTGGIIKTESVNDKPGTVTIKDLPSESRVTIKQVSKPGFKTDKITQKTDIKAGRESELNFLNRYSTKGKVNLISKKKIEGREIEPFLFLFDLYNNRNEIVQTVRNDSKGDIYFEPIEYTLQDISKETGIAEIVYTLKEKNDGRKGYKYDDKSYKVTVKLQDNGDGTITPTVEYSLNGSKVEIAEFTNIYKAEGDFDFVAYKEIQHTTTKPDANTVEYSVFDKNNTLVTKAVNEANGRIELKKAKQYTEKDIGKTFTYTIRETSSDEILFEKNEEYLKIQETVKDNGDGTLSVDQEYLGRFDSSDKIVDDESNAIPKLINIGKKSDLKVSKQVVGDYKEPDKQFKFKIKFTGDKDAIPKNLKIVRKKTTDVNTMSAANTLMKVANEGLGNVLKELLEDFSVSDENTPDAVQATGQEEGYVGDPDEGWESYTDPSDENGIILEVTNSYADGLSAIFNANNGETLKYKKEYKPVELLTDADKFPGNDKNWGNPGLVIKGWSTDAKATTPMYKVGAPIKDSDIYTKRSTEEATLNQVQLYAVWGKPGYVIEFNKNGGEGSMTNQEVSYDVNTKLSNNTFYYLGKRFIGWATTANGQVEYEPGAEIKKSEAEVQDDKLTLYAVWEDADLNLNSDTGEFEFTLKDGETAILKDIPPYLNYTIEEIEDPAWGLVESENTTGTTKSKDNKDAKFVNEYGAKSAKFSFSGFKYINGQRGSLDDFEFELIDRTNNKTYRTKADNKTGAFKFEELLFSKPGGGQYIIREVPHNNPNYTVDTNTYIFALTVKENSSGNLVVETKPPISSTTIPKFYNNSKQAKISITKELIGDWLDDTRSFRFKSIINGKEEEFTLKKGETKTIDTVYGAKYEIRELSKGYWTTTAENNIGTVDKDRIDIKFTNESTLSGASDGIQPTKIIKFNKQLIGRKLEDKEFRFVVELKNASGDIVKSYEAVNDKNGNIEVEVPLILLKKSKTIDIYEKIPTENADEDIIYDENKYTYTVTQEGIATEFTIVDNSGKTIEETAKFVNKVKPGKLDIKLNLIGATEKSKDTEFKVKVLYDGKIKELIMKNNSKEVVEIPSNTTYEITVEDLKTGFVLKNISNETGTITANNTINSVIDIEYQTSTNYAITATKKMVDSQGKDAKELLGRYTFNFMLVDGEGQVIGKSANDSEGNAVFNDMHYSAEDIGKTYKYKLVELDEGQFNIIFDKTVYEVEVKIEDTGEGIKAIPTIYQKNGEELEAVNKIEFINKYREDIKAPVTGYSKSIMTIAAIMTSLLVGLYFGLKKKKGLQQL